MVSIRIYLLWYFKMSLHAALSAHEIDANGVDVSNQRVLFHQLLRVATQRIDGQKAGMLQ